MKDPSDSAILDTRFPGYAWMPRWTRKYWTPQTAITLALSIFSAGSWVGAYLTAPDVRDLRKDIASLTARVSPTCQHGCLLTKEDMAVTQSHLEDLWKVKQDIDAEIAREAAKKAGRAAEKKR